MIVPGLAALLLGATPAPSLPSGDRVEYAQLSIREQIIIRVPARRLLLAPPITFHEKKADRCQSMEGLAGAVVNNDSVDIIYRGGARIRAQLEDQCPALDYYSGFYITPTADKRICAGRDAIHARSGGECQIRRFRKLIPDDPKAAKR